MFSAAEEEARKKVLENPFNACHRNHGKSDPPWAHSMTAAECRTELKRRGLAHTGTRAELIRRINGHNSWNLTLAGRHEIYQQKLKVYKESTVEPVVPFDYFTRLPIEIRLIIWDLSLPGPRALSVSNHWRSEERLLFHERDNHVNPIALSVCRESRQVALRRYRLCFGTTHIYANLPGGDVLHFGQSWRGWESLIGATDGLLSWAHEQYQHRSDRTTGKLADSVLNDLRQVTRLSIGQDILAFYDNSGDGARLREDLKIFPSLKQLLLVGGGSASSGRPLNQTPGIVKYGEFLPADRDRDYYTWNEVVDVLQVREDFLEKGLSEKEKEVGTSDVQIVAAYLVPNIPGDDWDRDLGEPFYLFEPSPKCRSVRIAPPAPCACDNCDHSLRWLDRAYGVD